jgi:hypothetical protein
MSSYAAHFMPSDKYFLFATPTSSSARDPRSGTRQESAPNRLHGYPHGFASLLTLWIWPIVGALSLRSPPCGTRTLRVQPSCMSCVVTSLARVQHVAGPWRQGWERGSGAVLLEVGVVVGELPRRGLGARLRQGAPAGQAGSAISRRRAFEAVLPEPAVAQNLPDHLGLAGLGSFRLGRFTNQTGVIPGGRRHRQGVRRGRGVLQPQAQGRGPHLHGQAATRHVRLVLRRGSRSRATTRRAGTSQRTRRSSTEARVLRGE